MRFREFNEEEITEGGKSDTVRYSSELGALLAFTGGDSLDTIPDSKLDNPKAVKEAIARVQPHLKEDVFNQWYEIALGYKAKILAHNGSLPQKYGWVAGANVGGVADVEFHNFPISGLSIKDKGGITLANLTPKAVGLEPLPKADVFQQYAPREYMTWKTKIFETVIAEAKQNPGVPIPGKYNIIYNLETDDFTVFHKKTWTMTESEMMDGIITTAPWQRAFGDWYQNNFEQYKEWMKPLVVSISKQFVEIISESLTHSAVLKRMLQFEPLAYYYATPNKLYYVPAEDDAGDLELKAIWYAAPNGTSQLFKAKIGNEDSDDGAILDVYIRYSNGMFAAPPTVRVQNLKDQQFIAWDEL